MFESIIQSIETRIPATEGDFAAFPSRKYNPVQISRANFHGIPALQDDKQCSIAFIDGGSAELLKAPSFSFQVIRTVAVLLQRGRHRLVEENEFFCLCFAEKAANDEEKGIVYKTELFPMKGALLLNPKDCQFSSMDKKLTEGTKRASVSAVANAVRRFAELAMAVKVSSSLGKEDLLVLDGTLEAYYTNEKGQLDVLYNKATGQGFYVTSLAKSSELLTDKGSSYSAVLNTIAPEGAWYYCPVAETDDENHMAKMYYVKLNNASNYSFRFEAYSAQDFRPEMYFRILALNSNDYAFPGYPYGLVLADKHARVSNGELSLLRARLIAECGSKWHNIKKFIHALDAHDVLNNMS